MIQWLSAGGEARAFYIPFSSIVLWMTPRTADTSGFLRHLNFFSFLSTARTPPHIKARDLKRRAELKHCMVAFLPSLFFIFSDCISLFLLYVCMLGVTKVLQNVGSRSVGHSLRFKARSSFFVQRKVFCRHDLHEFRTFIQSR